jgi:hypothetical protein
LLTSTAARQQAYISGHALVILGGPQALLQTIYVDDTEKLEAVAFDEASGKIAVCGGPDVFIYQPYGIQGETLKVRITRVGSLALSLGRRISHEREEHKANCQVIIVVSCPYLPRRR